ncbi:MAG: ABC transporter ATP-binding protein, partial [Bauldia litoralis]
MADLHLHVEGLVKRFGGLTATNHLDLEVERGELHAIIGPNGAGKTTLIAQLSGLLKPDAGRISFDGRDITGAAPYTISSLGLARSFQVTSIFLNFTAEDNVALAVQAHSGHSFRFWRRAQSDPALRKPAREALERVGLDHRADTIAADLSHGEQRQLEIAMAIATKPSMLLLDEPMAGMGTEESARMIDILLDFKKSHTILLIEHDMDAVFKLADR